jgi:hypothetical protein
VSSFNLDLAKSRPLYNHFMIVPVL